MENETQGQLIETEEEKRARIRAELFPNQTQQVETTNTPTNVESTEPTEVVEQEQTPTELTRMQQIFGVGKGIAGTKLLDYSEGPFLHGAGQGPIEYYKPGGDFSQATTALGTGTLDTAIDFANMVGQGKVPEIPKVPTFENEAAQAVRNIGGLVIPSLGLRGMAINAASRYHAAGKAAPWLQKLGNSKSFSFISKQGIEIGTAGLVDYTAKQNQEDDNLLGVLKAYWPKTFQWISGKYATTPLDNADQRRAKNVNEGAIFSMLGSIIEGVAVIAGAQKSLKRTSQFIPTTEGGLKKITEETTDDLVGVFDNIAKTPIEARTLENYARKTKILEDINAYYLSKGEAPVNWDILEEGDTLVRTPDPDGIAGASARAAAIQNNLGTEYGRIGNFTNEAARLQGLELENLYDRTLVSELAERYKNTPKFNYKSGKIKISDTMIDNAGKKLAGLMLNPRLDSDDIIGILDEFHRAVEGSAVRLVGKKGINKAITRLKQQMTDLDFQKARAYQLTADAGEVSDFAEGVRLMEESPTINRTIDMMADRLETLVVEKGLANFEANSMLQNINAWKDAVETGDSRIINATAETILANTDSRLTELIPKAKELSQTIKDIARQNPNFLKPYLLATEMADGNVDSLSKLHTYMSNKLGVFKKAIYDGNPEVPAVINKAFTGNVLNSMLSAFATPTNAAIGNLTGLLGKASATVTGAVLSGDFVRAQRAMTANFALDDTLQQATDYMRTVFRKAATNPKDVSYISRGDLALKAEKDIVLMREYAEAAAKEGEYGPGVLLQIFEDLDALSADPILRFGSNSMTAFDGFSKSILANTEAKMLALSKAASEGKVLTKVELNKAKNEIYNTFFDSNDLLNDDAINASAREIALNANSPTVDGINNFVKQWPISKAFIWFPRTTGNTIDVMKKWSPGGIFSEDYKFLVSKQLDEFTYDEMVGFLKHKGRKIDENAIENFKMLRYEVKGKAAIAGFFTTAAFFAGINDRCTGTGHYNRAIQRQRVNSGWQKKSCKVPGTDKYISYEWMGPIGDWWALMQDVVDNADTLSSSWVEDFMPKMWAILAGSLTDRWSLAQLEPLHDILKGNGAAASRFASNFANNTFPLGGARNELGKILYPQLRNLRSEFDDGIRNRNAWLDAFDPTRALPDVVDPIDGKSIRGNMSWYHRVYNAILKNAKITDQPSPENKWLQNIEFNSSPSMNMSINGARLENHEITAIQTKMGQQGLWKKLIRQTMKRAEKLTYTAPDGKVITGFENIIRAQRRGGISSEILDHTKFANVFNQLTVSYNKAKQMAEMSLANGTPEEQEIYAAIKQREYDLTLNKAYQTSGQLDKVLEETLNMAK